MQNQLQIKRQPHTETSSRLHDIWTACPDCQPGEAWHYVPDDMRTYWQDADEGIACTYCDNVKGKPMTELIICQDCESDLPGEPVFSKLLSETPIGTKCTQCNEIKTDQALNPQDEYTFFMWLYTQPPQNDEDPNLHKSLAYARLTRQRTAQDVADFIDSHGIEAHVTLTNLVRAMDTYTYRDDHGMVCTGYDWVLLDPTQASVIYEFLGY